MERALTAITAACSLAAVAWLYARPTSDLPGNGDKLGWLSPVGWVLPVIGVSLGLSGAGLVRSTRRLRKLVREAPDDAR